MKTVLMTKDGDRVTVKTRQYKNGILVDTIPETTLPKASFRDEKTYHEDLRAEIVMEGGEVLEEDNTPTIVNIKKTRVRGAKEIKEKNTKQLPIKKFKKK